MNLNKVQIIGRITQPLELKKLPNGTSALRISVATNHNYKNKAGEKIETTEFHNVISFGKQAEVVAQYFVKGQEIYCEGRLKTSTWDDKETQKKMYKTEIVLDQFEFGAKPQGASQPAAQNQEVQEQTPEEVNPEDIPF